MPKLYRVKGVMPLNGIIQLKDVETGEDVWAWNVMAAKHMNSVLQEGQIIEIKEQAIPLLNVEQIKIVGDETEIPDA